MSDAVQEVGRAGSPAAPAGARRQSVAFRAALGSRGARWGTRAARPRTARSPSGYRAGRPRAGRRHPTDRRQRAARVRAGCRRTRSAHALARRQAGADDGERSSARGAVRDSHGLAARYARARPRARVQRGDDARAPAARARAALSLTRRGSRGCLDASSSTRWFSGLTHARGAATRRRLSTRASMSPTTCAALCAARAVSRVRNARDGRRCRLRGVSWLGRLASRVGGLRAARTARCVWRSA